MHGLYAYAQTRRLEGCQRPRLNELASCRQAARIPIRRVERRGTNRKLYKKSVEDIRGEA